ncbi:hypothetical protein [Paraburkholderia kururiensis]|uniref:Uncharacterized protein n=1 Tax=Paraburkholderia kururiensis TaxID=984307 RepID=A0ABZ0WFG7_9BURK|nr:hypothetical protein [Paraburkholderia kururiensis]WQD76070.1 hypothetical protein U0042_18345 [Paraburkholderia kururiensis]
MTTGRFPTLLAVTGAGQMMRGPLCEFFSGITLLLHKPPCEPDCVEADSNLLFNAAKVAEMALQILHDGLASIGPLHSQSTQQITDGHLRVMHAVALGRSQVELCEELSYAYGRGIDYLLPGADYVAREGGEP